ncbi:MAG: site-specific DNA-methyltransferase [Alphaproteobacteria bacterium GM202ARS2]|nr:site-specific DNA-methyltransferase [Alphaproteobacteria bacterium GM202ARS2]
MLPKTYRDKIIHGDVMETLRALPDKCLDMVYGDPDYNVGINYKGRSYKQSWESYVDWYCALARESLRVLKDDGNLFLLNYPKQNAYLRVRFLDGAAYDVQDYVWVYNTNVGHSPRRFTTAHRSILHARKSKHNKFYKDNVAVPYKNPEDRRIRARMAAGHKGAMPYSWFFYNLVKNVSKDKTIHACQIPLGLVEMLIKASTQPGDSVFVLFGGSGSELVLAQELGRVFVSCELHGEYHRMIESRLQNNGIIKPQYRLLYCMRAAQEESKYGQASSISMA